MHAEQWQIHRNICTQGIHVNKTDYMYVYTIVNKIHLLYGDGHDFQGFHKNVFLKNQYLTICLFTTEQYLIALQQNN